MQMPGGGCHKVAPGQVTDDSELSLSLLHALIEGEGKLDLCAICKWYSKWLSSKPYDVGNTTRNGLSKCSQVNPDPSKAYQAAEKGAFKNSMSNGAMMRIAPLAVWARSLSLQDLESAVTQEVAFTHAQVAMKQLCTAYCLLIGQLIVCGEQEDRAQIALSAVQQYTNLPHIHSTVTQFFEEATTLASM